jgi:ArsR family transcriptional regulator, arsenate/arsenite/antimonite-responsive transcriptional repressor
MSYARENLWLFQWLKSDTPLSARVSLLRSTREGRTIIYRSNVEGMRALIGFLVSECCDGHPELCNLVAADAAACCGPAPAKTRKAKKAVKRKG